MPTFDHPLTGWNIAREDCEELSDKLVDLSTENNGARTRSWTEARTCVWAMILYMIWQQKTFTNSLAPLVWAFCPQGMKSIGYIVIDMAAQRLGVHCFSITVRVGEDKLRAALWTVVRYVLNILVIEGVSKAARAEDMLTRRCDDRIDHWLHAYWTQQLMIRLGLVL